MTEYIVGVTWMTNHGTEARRVKRFHAYTAGEACFKAVEHYRSPNRSNFRATATPVVESVTVEFD